MIDVKEIPLASWPGFPNVSVIRGDQIHPVVSGNKLYKLVPLIHKALEEKKSTLISVGGRYSNHLHALAWVGREFGFKTVGLVRGFKEQALTPTLRDCLEWGMEIHFVDFHTYEQRYSSVFWQAWLAKFPYALRINEGGWSEESIQGSAQWWNSVPQPCDILICAVGSGSMLAGLKSTAPTGTEVIGVPVFKDPDQYSELRVKLSEVIGEEDAVMLWDGFAGKGFGRLTDEQKAFKQQFEVLTGILLDPVYTTKTFHALHTKLESDPALRTKRISILHSGGLQGNRT